MENLKNDPQYFVDEHFAPLIRQIDLHFERRNEHNNPKRFKLLDRIKSIKNDIIHKFDHVKDNINDIDEIKLMLTNYSTYTFKDENIIHRFVDTTNVNLPFLLSGELDRMHIYINNNKIHPIESNISNSHIYLERLYLYRNNIKELPSFDKLVHLKVLYLSDNKITVLPEHVFDKLVCLEVLDLSLNEITMLPSFDKLVCLEVLDLRENQLTVLPDHIFDMLVRLEVLDLRRNKISLLPSLNKLVHLETLQLGDNQLTELPSFDKLSDLKYLNLSYNKLTILPSFNKLNLKVLYIDNSMKLPSINKNITIIYV